MQMDHGTDPLAYGYVRMEEPDRSRISRFRRDLATFCELSGYRLVSVFVDRGVTDEQFAGTGFTDLVALAGPVFVIRAANLLLARRREDRA